ncbi:MAG: PcfJ domain-containing protein [Spirochaetota bacterium]
MFTSRTKHNTHHTAYHRDAAKKLIDAEIKSSLQSLADNKIWLRYYKRLLQTVLSHSHLLKPNHFGYCRFTEAKKYHTAILSLAAFGSQFIRPIEDWEGNYTSPRETFYSLFQHLLGEYPTAKFLHSVWMDTKSKDSRIRQAYHIQIARGKSFRRINPELNFTRQMEHWFLQAPDHYSYTEAIRFGQMKGMKSEDWLIQAIVDSRLGRNLDNEKFWRQILHFLHKNQYKNLCEQKVGMIIDFLQAIKFERKKIYGTHGIFYQEPPQADFSLRGVTCKSLLALSEDWHERVHREKEKGFANWNKSHLGDFEYVEKVQDPQTPTKYWSIKELLTNNELFWEGRNLRHCVRTYESQCIKRQTTIWSMAYFIKDKRLRVLTIEVNPFNKRVVQVRGKNNRFATKSELKIIQRWCKKEGLIL